MISERINNRNIQLFSPISHVNNLWNRNTMQRHHGFYSPTVLREKDSGNISKTYADDKLALSDFKQKQKRVFSNDRITNSRNIPLKDISLPTYKYKNLNAVKRKKILEIQKLGILSPVKIDN